MQNSSTRYIMLLLLTAVLIVAGISYFRVVDFKDNTDRLAEGSVISTGVEVGRFISDTRRSVQLFVDTYHELISGLSQNCADVDSVERLNELLMKHFPTHFAFTIANPEGKALLEGFDGLVGKGCRRDIRKFTGHLQDHNVYIHSSPQHKPYHFDLMATFPMNGGRTGTFFLSFSLERLTQLLKQAQLPDHKLFLVMEKPVTTVDAFEGEVEYLVEVSADGGRDEISRSDKLTSEEVSVLLASTPVASTNWQLFDIPQPKLVSSALEKIIGQAGLIVLILISGSLLALWRVRHEEQIRHRAELDLRQAKDEIEEAYLGLEEAHHRISYLANYDSLTDLPNRNLFHDRFSQGLSYAARNGGRLALMYVDLDGFKQVNDDHGHDAGDLLLKKVANSLKDQLRETDTVARLGGDEFCLLMPDPGTLEETELVASRVIRALGISFLLNDVSVTISASLGIATYPDHADSKDGLIKLADAAMYEAKKCGKNRYCVTGTEKMKSHAESGLTHSGISL